MEGEAPAKATEEWSGKGEGVIKDSDSSDGYTGTAVAGWGDHPLKASDKERTTHETVEENVIKIRTPS